MKMRWWMMFVALLLLPASAHTQAADPAAIAAQQAAMEKLKAMRGLWRGPAVTYQPEGEIRLTQTERVGTFLDGTVTLVEGKAFRPDGSVGFRALGLISYDIATGKYWMTSHAQGRAGRFEVKVTGDGFTWDIPAGPATIRYVAKLTPTTWTEVGDYLSPGQPPRRFHEMTLSRLGDTDWPEAGGLAED